MRISALVVFSFSYALLLTASPSRFAQDDVRLIIQTRQNRTVFRIGEVISIELAFSSSTPGAYSFRSPVRDRRPCFDWDHFDIQPAMGWSDPLALHFRSLDGIFCSGPAHFQELSSTPVQDEVDLNDWVHFDELGQYKITIRSERVCKLHSTQADHHSCLEVKSNPIQVEIVAATPEWQERTLEDAVNILDSTPSNRRGPPNAQRKRAIAVLQHLGTDAAAYTLTRYLGSDVGEASWTGLVSSGARGAKLSAMQECLVDSDCPVSPQLVYAIAELTIPKDGNTDWELYRLERQTLEDSIMYRLKAAIDGKQGEALGMSKYTLRNWEWTKKHLRAGPN